MEVKGPKWPIFSSIPCSMKNLGTATKRSYSKWLIRTNKRWLSLLRQFSQLRMVGQNLAQKIWWRRTKKMTRMMTMSLMMMTAQAELAPQVTPVLSIHQAPAQVSSRTDFTVVATITSTMMVSMASPEKCTSCSQWRLQCQTLETGS